MQIRNIILKNFKNTIINLVDHCKTDVLPENKKANNLKIRVGKKLIEKNEKNDKKILL